jgi:hypothetical protein
MVSLHLVHPVQFLHNDSSGSATSVANSSNTILARLQLMQQCNQDTRAGATKSMAERDGSS